MQARLPLAVLTVTLLSCGGSREDLATTESVIGDTADAIYAAPPPCGYALSCHNGTCARSNGVDTGTGWSCGGTGWYGLDYQCVELVNRYNISHGYGPRIYGNAGYSMCNNAPSASYIVFRPGSTAKPRPGDALEWENSYNTGGHTAIVTGVSGSTLYFFQQNVGTRSSYWPTGSVQWYGSNFGWYSGLRPVCWIRARRNPGY